MAIGQRETLLAGAAVYVLEHGFSGLSLRPLARALGTSDRMLVYHFGSKEALVRQVMGHLSAGLAAIVAGNAVHADTAAAVVRMLWEVFRSDLAAPYIRVYLELFALSLHDPELYGEVVSDLTLTWTAYVGQLLATTAIPRDRRGTAALQVLATLDGLFIFRQATKNLAAADQAAEQFASRIDVLLDER